MSRGIAHSLAKIFVTQNGNKVRVEMESAPDVSQEANFRPRKIAVIRKCSFVGPGTVITGMGSAYLLVLQDNLTQLNRFRAIEITDYLPWVRRMTRIDPVTRMERADRSIDMQDTPLALVIEPMRLIKDQGIERPKVMIRTGADVRIGDFLGPYQVNAVTHALGIKLLEVF